MLIMCAVGFSRAARPAIDPCAIRNVAPTVCHDMNCIQLLSTDFDGTLIGHPSDGRCVPALAAALSDFHSAGGLWAVNTGRSVEHAIEGLIQFAAPVQPDFLLTNEREVFRRSERGDWEDFGDWNATCRATHETLFHANSPVFDSIRAVLAESHDITVIEENGIPAGLITADETVMERVDAALSPISHEFVDFAWQRNTVYLRFCHKAYHKGAALGELGRLTGISAANTMAAGDHFNDLSMLCGTYAAHAACPANAINPVKEAVAAIGGYVSDRNFGDGIADAMMSIGACSTRRLSV